MADHLYSLQLEAGVKDSSFHFRHVDHPDDFRPSWCAQKSEQDKTLSVVVSPLGGWLSRHLMHALHEKKLGKSSARMPTQAERFAVAVSCGGTILSRARCQLQK
jgi:hypothetical protein